MDSNDYSVDPSVIGRTVEIAAGLEEVTVTCGSRVVARHPRCRAAHQSTGSVVLTAKLIAGHDGLPSRRLPRAAASATLRRAYWSRPLGSRYQHGFSTRLGNDRK